MSSSIKLTAGDQSSLLSSLPLEYLVRAVAASSDAVAGLKALAAEVGSRDGAKIRQLAERLQRGETITQWQPSDASKVSLLQASAMDDSSLAGRVPRWVLLHDQRTQSRSQLHRVVWFCFGYLLAAAIGGWLIQVTVTTYLAEVSSDYTTAYLSQPAQAQSLVMQDVIRRAYQGTIVILIGLAMLWASRQCSRFGQRVERFWNQVPFIGSTYRAIDLAQMCEAIYQALSASWTYPQALRTAASQSKSMLLRDWLLQGAARIEGGESFEAVMSTCPLRASLLSGMSPILSTPTSGNVWLEQWRIVSDRLHQLMIRRACRIATVLAPAVVLLSIVILAFGWGWAMKSVFTMLDLLMWY